MTYIWCSKVNKIRLHWISTLTEYQVMKLTIKNLFKSSLNAESNLLFYILSNTDKYSDLIIIFDHIITLLATFVNCERCFSLMNMIKVDRRNKK